MAVARSVVVSEDADDYKIQSTGHSGTPVAGGLIGAGGRRLSMRIKRNTHARCRCRVAKRGVVAVMSLAILLVAGCSMLRGSADSQPSAKTATATAIAGQVAPLRAIGGSAVSGKIRVIDRGDGATVLVSAINMPRGGFRIAFHENPNCSSPNGLSAGPAWAPAGQRPQDLVPAQYVNSEERVDAEIRIAGLHASGVNGVAGHSVVIYAGPDVTTARPDVANERVACGVFEPAQPVTF